MLCQSSCLFWKILNACNLEDLLSMEEWTHFNTFTSMPAESFDLEATGFLPRPSHQTADKVSNTYCTFGKLNIIDSLIESFFCDAMYEWRAVVSNLSHTASMYLGKLVKGHRGSRLLVLKNAMSFSMQSWNFQLWIRIF